MITPSSQFLIYITLLSLASIVMPLALVILVFWQGFYRQENRFMALFLFASSLSGVVNILRQIAVHAPISPEPLVKISAASFLVGTAALLGFVNQTNRSWHEQTIRWWVLVSLGIIALFLPFSPSQWFFFSPRFYGANSFIVTPTPLIAVFAINAFLQLAFLFFLTVQTYNNTSRAISWSVFIYVVAISLRLVLFYWFIETGLNLILSLAYTMLFSYAIFLKHHLNPLAQLNQRLRESDGRYRALIDMVFDLDFVIESDPESGDFLVDWTKGRELAQDHFPTRIDATFKDLYDHIPPHQHEKLALFLRQLHQGKPSHIDLEIDITPQNKLWLANYVYPVWDDEQQAVIRGYGAARDITERKQAEEALIANERRFRAMFAQTFQMIGLFDRKGRFIELNETACKFFGIEDPSLYVDQHILTFIRRYAEPSQLPNAEKLVTAVLNNQASRQEWLMYNKDGEVRTLDVSLSAIHDHEGSLSLVLCEASDITDHQRATKAMIQAQKAESLGVLAGGVAHDFNNLLTSILAQSSLAIHKLGEEHSVSKNIKKAIFSAEQAATLAQHLLAYAGRGDFILEPIDINETIRNNIDLFHASTESHIDLHLELSDSLPYIDADGGQTQQIIMNLMINAAEAIDSETGNVIVRTALIQPSQFELNQYISKIPLTTGDYVMLEVEDNGCGLSPQIQNRIFDPFFSTKADGRGLGLAALLGAVYAQLGGVYVESVEQIGTTFRVIFPASKAKIRTNNPNIDQTNSVWETKKRITVLLADDEESIREVVTEGCNLLNWPIYSAENGLEALELYKQHQEEIDVVVLDMKMPVMAGPKTYWALKQITPDLPIILSSGYNPSQSAQFIRVTEHVSFVQKPYQIETLINTILRLIDNMNKKEGANN